MKTKLFALLLILPMMTFCTPDPIDPGQEGPEQPADTTQQQPVDTNAVVEQRDSTEIFDGALVLATNPNVEKFLTEVTYPDHDYTYTKILDYPGGYNATRPENEKVESDVPPQYNIYWKANAEAGKLKFEMSDATWKMEQDINAGDSTVVVTNLVPNTHYTYKVTSTVTGEVMTKGEFDTYGSLHQVFFKKEVRNGRDLGGWKTYDGKMVKYRKVYRGGRLEAGTMTRSGIKGIEAEGIKAQLDIRGEDANEKAAISGMDFCAPIVETGGDSMLKQRDTLRDEAGNAMYEMVTNPQTGKEEKKYLWGAYKMYHCMQFIIDCVKADKPVYFHCSLGRDRTGTLAMVVLGVLDVIEGDISKEYEVSYFSPRGWSIAYSETYKTFQNTRTKWAYKPAAEYIWKNYVNGDERFSKGVERYLLEIGISQADIDTFRELMLTEPYPEKTPVAAE